MKCLCVLQRWSCRKVFHKKKGAERVIFASAVLGERRRWAAATCHWERCTYIGAMKGQRQLSTGQSSHTNSWLQLPSSAFTRSPAPSLCLSTSICPHLCASFTQTPPPPFHTVLSPSSCRLMVLQREPPSPYSPPR